MRRIVLAAICGLLLLAGIQPAAALARPSPVGLVSFVGASFSRSTQTAGLSLDWPDVRRASGYQVFMSRSYGMGKAKVFRTRSSKITVTKLAPGRDYFFQVRGVRGSSVGSKSQRVGHTTIVRMDPAKGPTYRVMTYNMCSDVCSGWTTRRPAALGRITAYRPDLLATQEASKLRGELPADYSEAVYKSAKLLAYKTSRFDRAPAVSPLPREPAAVEVRRNADGSATTCDRTYSAGSWGYVYLGFHGDRSADRDSRGCRYGVWAELIDRQTGEHVMVVDVHTVSGSTRNRTIEREAEMRTLVAAVKAANPRKLRTIFAGDFNSHKNRAYGDTPAIVLRSQGYRDAFDLAMRLSRQHQNSFNGLSTTPIISYKWGDHVDHVFVDPDDARVLAWSNGALMSGNRLVTPIPSDHSPIVVDVMLN